MDVSLKSDNSDVVRLIAKILKTTGLIAILAITALVCNQKLEYLKQTKNYGYNISSADDSIRQLECLTRNIYWEAASEPFEGKVGVAQVTLNRVESGKFADSVCGVVYQKNVIYQKVICQFSWYCETLHKTHAVHQEMWKESETVAKKVLFEKFRLPSLNNALYYHADYVNPNWKKPKIEKIGRHIFYGERT
jgi:spore germination cell wall hydrolase CwlJ-like protein